MGSDAENLVSTCENLVSALQTLPPQVIKLCWAGFPSSKTLSIAATCAHARVYYYIELRNKCASAQKTNAYNMLNYIITDPNSGYNDLTPDEKLAIFHKNSNIAANCFVFT